MWLLLDRKRLLPCAKGWALLSGTKVSLLLVLLVLLLAMLLVLLLVLLLMLLLVLGLFGGLGLLKTHGKLVEMLWFCCERSTTAASAASAAAASTATARAATKRAATSSTAASAKACVCPWRLCSAVLLVAACRLAAAAARLSRKWCLAHCKPVFDTPRRPRLCCREQTHPSLTQLKKNKRKRRSCELEGARNLCTVAVQRGFETCKRGQDNKQGCHEKSQQCFFQHGKCSCLDFEDLGKEQHALIPTPVWYALKVPWASNRGKQAWRSMGLEKSLD